MRPLARGHRVVSHDHEYSHLKVTGVARHMAVVIILTAWIVVMAYVIVGNYLYFTKVLPRAFTRRSRRLAKIPAIETTCPG